MYVVSIAPPTEPGLPRTAPLPGYYEVPPTLVTQLMDPSSEGRLAPLLRQAAQLRDGNMILQMVARLAFANLQHPGTPPVSPDVLTALTQLAVTGSNAYAAFALSNGTPTPSDLTPYLTGLGMTADKATQTNSQIMSDFGSAVLAVRNPAAGMNEKTLRAVLQHPWIAVSGEDDPPDYPVNVPIARYPQFHQDITVDGHNLHIRYIVASSQPPSTVPMVPSIPPGDEVVIFLHGEGSRAEEALDFIPQLFNASAGTGHSFTVIALDFPGCGYTTRVLNGVHETVPPGEISLFPPVPGLIDTSPDAGSPLLDFVSKSIETFVKTLVLPFGNPITAIVGGSQGGHMALRLAASQLTWVTNIIAWSPASVWERNASFCGFPVPHRALANHVLAQRVVLLGEDQPDPPNARQDFFTYIWDQNAFQPDPGAAAGVAAGILEAGAWFVPPLAVLGLLTLVGCYMALPTVPKQPDMWYRSDWQPLKDAYIDAARRDRREVYNKYLRQWHWRIAEESVNFTFDALRGMIKKPLLLMVGESDDFPGAHFFPYVTQFAGTLSGPGHAVSIPDTGHSIHIERPAFLAQQFLDFVSGIVWLDQSGSPLVRFTGDLHQWTGTLQTSAADTGRLVLTLNLTITTGADDLRGGGNPGDNCDVILGFAAAASITFSNVNSGTHWNNGETHMISLPVPPGTKSGDIVSLTLRTGFGGGISGDNWNVDQVLLQVTLRRPPVISLLDFARSLGSKSVSGIAAKLGVKWPPPPTISLRNLASFRR